MREIFFIKAKKMVGIARFELATFCPPDKRANQAALHPDLLFYNIPLFFKKASVFFKILAFFKKLAVPPGVEPRLNEPKSLVLPLHHGTASVLIIYYTF